MQYSNRHMTKQMMLVFSC